jgi:uncharacterized OsmC-like protein
MSQTQASLRDLQAPIKQRFREDPASAFTTTSAQSAPYDPSDPLHCQVAPSEFPELVIDAGLHPLAGGDHAHACSGDLLAAALAACEESTIRSVAANMGIELESVEVKADIDWDFRGTMGVDRSVPVGAAGARVRSRVKVRDGVDPERARRFLASAERYCAVLQTLRSGVAVETTFDLE